MATTKKPAARKRSATKKAPARKRAAAKKKPKALTPYKPKHTALPSSGFDHHAAESNRQAELQAERDLHNRRTGDASL